MFPGKPDSLIRFWLTFERAGTFGFHVGENTAALAVLAEQADVDADMAQYGRLMVREAGPGDPPARAIGQVLLGVDDLHGPAPARTPTAARLRFESVDICAADYDDDLCWALGELPVGSAT